MTIPVPGSARPGAEIIPFDAGRRAPGDGTGRRRCGAPTVRGDPCRNPARGSGYCRLHEPRAADAGRAQAEAPAQDGRAEPDRVRRDALVRAGLGFLRRRLTGDYDVDAYGFDRELSEEVVLPLARLLYRHYWRVGVSGVEHVPAQGGALVVANHAGTLPFDALMLKVALLDEHPAHRHLRGLAADLALRLPVIGPLARKSGNTLAHADDARRLLANGELVGVWPEGYQGLGKRYRDRYRLQRFGRGGFVEVALRARVPIVPVAIIGSEEIFPVVADVKLLARLLGVPYFPVTWQFPLLGPLGLVPLPSRWLIDVGEAIDTSGYGPGAADDPMLVLELTDRLRDGIQQMLYSGLPARSSTFR